MTAVRKSRRRAPENRAQNQAEILEAAARAIAQHGYWGMTMRDLAKAMNRSLASFYNYYGSKEDVLYALQTGAFEALIEGASRSAATVEDPASRLHAFILNHVKYVAEHPHVMRVLVHEAAALPAPRRTAIRQLKQRYFELGRDLVTAVAQSGSASRKGSPARITPAEIDHATYAIFGMMNWMWSWYAPSRHGTPEDVARSFHRLAMGGVAGSPRPAATHQAVERALHELDRPLLISVES